MNQNPEPDADPRTAPQPEVPVVEDVNPAADLAFLDVIPKVERLKQLEDALDRIRCCKRTGRRGDYDHSDCKPLEALEQCLQLVLKHGASGTDLMPGSKGKLTVIQFVYEKFMSGECPLDLDPESEVKLDTKRDCAQFVYERARALGVPFGVKRTKIDRQDFFYDRQSKSYWALSKTGVWQSYNRAAAADHLAAQGISALPPGPGLLSDVDRELVNIRDYCGVDLAMPLAGYAQGLHRIKDLTVLVTRSFTLVEPKEDVECKKWRHILAIIDGLLGLGTPDMPKQGGYLLHKLHCDLAALKAAIRSGGLALLIAGLPDSGKTVLLSIIRKVLGGRSAIASGYLTEKTTFNADLASAEVHTIDDGNPFTDRAARRRFANLIKQSVASDEVWVHGKGKDAFALALYRRLFILTNLDSLDAMPELEESLLDKIMLLKAVPFEMPEGLTPLPPMHDVAAFEAFDRILDEELPYFIWYLENYEFPDNLKQRRFGTKPYKNPALLSKLKQLGHADEVHFLVQRVLFRGTLALIPEELQDTAVAGRSRARLLRDDGIRVVQEGVVEVEVNNLLLLLLEPETRERARHLFHGPKVLGCALAEVKRDHPKLYKRRRSHGKTYWTVVEDVEPVHDMVVARREHSPAEPGDAPAGAARGHRKCWFGCMGAAGSLR